MAEPGFRPSPAGRAAGPIPAIGAWQTISGQDHPAGQGNARAGGSMLP